MKPIYAENICTFFHASIKLATYAVFLAPTRAQEMLILVRPETCLELLEKIYMYFLPCIYSLFNMGIGEMGNVSLSGAG